VHPGEAVAYAATSEGRVLFLDLAKPGQLLRRFPPQGTLATIMGPPAIGSKGIYIADANGMLYCIDKTSGTELWRSDVGSPIGSGILAHDGRIYVPTRPGGTSGGSLLCLEEGDL